MASAAEKVRRQRERAQHLIALANSDSYPVLKEIIVTKGDRAMRRFISTPSVSQQELDWGRGFMHGMQIVLDVIENGEKQLEAAIKTAQTLDELEGE